MSLSVIQQQDLHVGHRIADRHDLTNNYGVSIQEILAERMACA